MSSSSSTIRTQLEHLFPNPTHIAIPHAIQILTSLRAVSTSSRLGLSGGEVIALPGVSAVLACERTNSTDSISIPQIQKLSSTTRKLFDSALTKCRAYTSSTAATRTPSKRRSDDVVISPLLTPSAVKRTPQSATRKLDLSGLKRATFATPQIAAGQTTSRRHDAEVQESQDAEDELRLTPTKRRRVDGDDAVLESVLPAVRRSTERPDIRTSPPWTTSPRHILPRLTELPISPYVSIPHPRISITSSGPTIYEPPERPEDGLVFRKLVPAPAERSVDEEDLDDKELQVEERVNSRRYARREEIRLARGVDDQQRDVGWDAKFWVGFSGKKESQVEDDPREDELGMWIPIVENHPLEDGKEEVPSWEERLDDYVEQFPESVASTSTDRPTSASPTPSHTPSLSHLPASPSTPSRRRLLPSKKKQLDALKAAKAAQAAEEAKARKEKEEGERRWLARAEVRGIAVKLFVEQSEPA